MQQAVQCDLLFAGGRDMMAQQEYMQYTGMQADSIASDGHFNGYAKSSFHVAVQSTYSSRHESLCHGLTFSFQFKVHGVATDAVVRHARHVHQRTLQLSSCECVSCCRWVNAAVCQQCGIANNASDAWSQNGGGKFSFKIDKSGWLTAESLVGVCQTCWVII